MVLHQNSIKRHSNTVAPSHRESYREKNVIFTNAFQPRSFLSMSIVEILSLLIGVLGLVATVAIFVVSSKKERLAKERGLLDELMRASNALAGSLSPAPLNDILSEIVKSPSQVNSSQQYAFKKDVTEIVKWVNEQIALKNRAIDNLIDFKRKHKKDTARLTQFREDTQNICNEFIACTRDVLFLVNICNQDNIPETIGNDGISEMLRDILVAEKKEKVSNVVADMVSQRFRGNEIPNLSIKLSKLSKAYAKEEGESISEDEMWWINKPFFGNGSPEVQESLGVRYYWIEKKYEKGADWFERAAKQGSALAQCHLGYCYEYGQGREKNESMAADWYEKAALQNDPSGLYFLGKCIYEGRGRRQDVIKGADLFEQAALFGNEGAQYELGRCYAKGIGREQDDKKAADWFEKAALQDDEEAQCELGTCYDEGKGREKDLKKAADWYEVSAQHGNAEAQRRLGFCFFNGDGRDENAVEAANWFEKAANQGDASAQYELGLCYARGEGRAQDFDKAADLYEKAAEQGHSAAQNNLGKCYYDGLGRKIDLKKAVEWYHKSAAQGDSIAYYNIANMCFSKEIQGNALVYYKKAANSGYLKAVRWVGKCYETGNGILANQQKAQAYYDIADRIDEALARGVYPEPYVDPYPEDSDTVILD